MLSREQVSRGLASHYSRKLGGDVWAYFDESKRQYAIRGEGLPPHPDLIAMYPNGWSLLDFIKPARARQLVHG
jgi:hypothetical protein